MSYERLGALMGRDPEQLGGWVSGRVTPCEKNTEKIKSFLVDFEQ
jgi:hypothetical protein